MSEAKKCFFTHDWAAWADVAQSTRGSILVQERRCTRCNKAVRRQTTWKGGDLDYLDDGPDLPR